MPRAASRSPIFAEIWSTVRHIPRGKVASYGEIARLSGFIGQARRVGYALRSAPPGMRLPWHRVVNSEGRISLPKGDGSYQRQKRLLEKEGISLKAGKIDLQKHGWIRKLKYKRRQIR